MNITPILCILTVAAAMHSCSPSHNQDFSQADTVTTHQHHHSTNEHYEMLLQTSAKTIEAGKSVKLSFKPLRNKTTDVLLETSHEKKIHLIIVNNDLTYFEHIHPETDGAQYSVETTFPSGGRFLLFVEYTPVGGTHQIQKFQVDVKGVSKAISSIVEERLICVVDGYTVRLDLPNEKLSARTVGQIPVTISQDTTELSATDFDDYLGSKAHAIMIGMADKSFQHAHPQVVNNKLNIHIETDKPGFYRLWLQFMTGGALHTADFTIHAGNNTLNKNPQIIHQH